MKTEQDIDRYFNATSYGELSDECKKVKSLAKQGLHMPEARGIIKEAKQEILDACDRDDFMPDETAEFLRELEAFLEDTDA